MPGSETAAKKRSPRALAFDSLQVLAFDNVAAIAAAAVSTTIQSQLILPFSCKIFGASLSYTAIGTPLGQHFFNVVLGNGAYETTNGVVATASQTVAAPHTGDVVTIGVTIPAALAQSVGILNGGNPVFSNVVYTVKSTDTTATILAGSLTAALNQNDLFNSLFIAQFVAGAMTYYALESGTAYNAINFTGSVTGAGATTTITAAVASAGGTNNTGYNPVATNNSYPYTGQFNFASNNNTPIFSADQLVVALAPGTLQQGQYPFTTQNFDALYPQGSVLTLRTITPAATGALTNFKVLLAVKPFDVYPSRPTLANFDPNQDLG